MQGGNQISIGTWLAVWCSASSYEVRLHKRAYFNNTYYLLSCLELGPGTLLPLQSLLYLLTGFSVVDHTPGSTGTSPDVGSTKTNSLLNSLHTCTLYIYMKKKITNSLGHHFGPEILKSPEKFKKIFWYSINIVFTVGKQYGTIFYLFFESVQ